MKSSALQQRRNRVLALCQRLPEVEISGEQHLALRVRKKTFGYFLDNHQGDGIVGLVCKATPGAQDFLLHMDPVQLYVPAYVGPLGWVGLRLDLAEVNRDHAARLLTDGYRLAAPKRLAALLAPASPPPTARSKRA